ncbi:putative enzyme [Thiomonas sp. X19]|uniref:SDR family NAD(P)-dependent oxidoreductase n=1 Tax=Thiomonas sp. X19 TaxID=1050370 RepID=UPI000B65E742|nr:SDR family NAD(P)-dependent oxidoreductase [Thiomonas sp. X19]SCC93097.1 putative enzyme [Thiomonas sp. X19]
MTTTKIAIVTGSSSGIGEATARALAAAGYTVYLGARRLDRLRAIAADIQGRALPLDVTDKASVEAFAAALPKHVHVLVNNAGGAIGLGPVAEFDEDQWLAMFQSNVLGLARMTRALHGRLQASGDGHVINIGSVAGFETYVGGAGYTAAKHAVRAISDTLRLEWLGQPMRVTEIDPGLVETDFSLVRFDGDAARAAKVYANTRPLSAGDVADAVVWAATRPAHVNIDQIVIRPTDQARADKVFRRTGV